MAHFAKVGDDNIVTQVVVVANEIEDRGEEFLSQDLGLGGRWVQTSYNNNFRGIFAAIGYWYDEANDVFVAPVPPPVVEEII
jgi:hypothetical protein